MKSLFLFTILLSLNSWSSNILVIGDSHTAGPFGRALLTELGVSHNVAVYGHSSSASIDWMKTGKAFSGGIFHGAIIGEQVFNNPRPVHWRTKVETPFLEDFLSNMLKYESWQRRVGTLVPDTVVVALGANDIYAVNRSRAARNYRQQFIEEMANSIIDKGMKCIWIAPPDSVIFKPGHLDNVYSYLKEVTDSKCEFFSSQHYKAIKWLSRCDGLHFSCNSESRALANQWALEASRFIKGQI